MFYKIIINMEFKDFKQSGKRKVQLLECFEAYSKKVRILKISW